jgi:hypothetical protein
MIPRPRIPSVLFLGLSLLLATGVFAATATVCKSTDTTLADENCGCDVAPLQSFFYTVDSYPVNVQSTASGPQYNVTLPTFDGRVVWQLVFDPVVYASLDEATNQENAARLQAIAQALADGTLTALSIELRDNFNGDSTFLAMIDGEPNETLDRAGARQALFGDGSAFSTGETLRAVGFISALGYEGVPMFLHGRTEAGTTQTSTAAAQRLKLATTQMPPEPQQPPQPQPQPPAPLPQQPQYAACARSLDGTQCNQNPPTLPCPLYAYTQWVRISCPTGENYSLPFWKLLLQWDFWKSLVCRCSLDYESRLEIRAGTCNFHRPILTPWNRVCGCT